MFSTSVAQAMQSLSTAQGAVEFAHLPALTTAISKRDQDTGQQRSLSRSTRREGAGRLPPAPDAEQIRRPRRPLAQ
ncbi:unnamed protein product, partial [Mesorhabditis spiculigera]